MKLKSFKTAKENKDWKETWLQTAVSIVSLVFLILLNVGVLTPDQVAEATPLMSSTLGALSTVITGVIALIGLLFKRSAPTV
jgi:protein-S-isoprenylcysteine O-methyltransferase Ste14